MNYNVSGNMTPDKNAIIERYPARSNIEDRVRTLEMWMSQMKEAFNAIGRAATGLNTPPPQLPMDEPLLLLCDRGQSPVEHFGLDKSRKAGEICGRGSRGTASQRQERCCEIQEEGVNVII